MLLPLAPQVGISSIKTTTTTKTKGLTCFKPGQFKLQVSRTSVCYNTYLQLFLSEITETLESLDFFPWVS